MNSVSRLPHSGLRAHVHSYTGFAERSAEPVRRREVPVGLIPLIVSFGPRWRLVDPYEPARSQQHRVSFVAGLHTIPALVEHAGESAGVQVDLTPLGAHMLLGVPMDSLANQIVELEAVVLRHGDGGPQQAEVEAGDGLEGAVEFWKQIFIRHSFTEVVLFDPVEAERL